jgi:hypothetical protein
LSFAALDKLILFSIYQKPRQKDLTGSAFLGVKTRRRAGSMLFADVEQLRALTCGKH